MVPQVSLYIADESMARLRTGAKASGCSLSKYVATLVDTDSPTGYPAGFFKLYGRLRDVSLERPEDTPLPAVQPLM